MSDVELNDQQKIALVLSMFEAWERKEWVRAVQLFAPDGVFHNVMLEPTVGREAILARLSRLRCAQAGNVLWMAVRHIGVIDGLVFVERADSWDFDGVKGGIPVVGVIEFTGDRIARWREFYDRASLRREAGYDREQE